MIELVNASLTGFKASLDYQKRVMYQNCKGALAEVASEIFRDAQSMVPRKTGALASSGRITQDETESSDLISVTISYGDSFVNPRTHVATRDYAVKRHEMLYGGKWLENALLNSSIMFESNLANKISSNLK